MLLKTFSKNQGALFLLPRCIGKKKKTFEGFVSHENERIKGFARTWGPHLKTHLS